MKASTHIPFVLLNQPYPLCLAPELGTRRMGSQSSPRSQTPLRLLQNLHTHLGQSSFVTLPHPSFAISPLAGCLLLIQAPHTASPTCSAHPCHIKCIHPVLALAAPHYLAPPNLCKLIAAASSQHFLVSSQDGCTLLPSLPCVMLQPRTNTLPTSAIQISFSSHLAHKDLSLYLSPSPFFASCHPVLSYIPQC